jgi:predicted DNA-binding transcriptional regulator AlpA
MKEYEFTLKFNFPDSSVNPESYLDSLAQAGCDDALVGIGQQGRIAFNFNREADSALSALCSAIEQVKSVIPGVQLIEATPDFVGLSDIAEVVGCSQQNLRQLMLNNQASFPPPVYEGKAAIWHLSSVLDWLKDKKDYAIDNALLDMAKATMQLNITRDTFKLDPAISKKFNALLS